MGIVNEKYSILSEEETEIIRRKLEARLYETMKDGWSPYWYPLKQVKKEVDVIAFNSNFWNDDSNMKLLSDILKNINIGRVYSLQECSRVYVYEEFFSESVFFEEDEDGYSLPYYSENYIWDESHRWLIYTSHEGTIAFAGKHLVEGIRTRLNSDEFEQECINKKYM